MFSQRGRGKHSTFLPFHDDDVQFFFVSNVITRLTFKSLSIRIMKLHFKTYSRYPAMVWFHSNYSLSFKNSLLTKAHFTYWSSLPPCTSTLMAIPPHTIVFPHVATLRHICIVITTIKSDFPAVSWFAKSTFYFDCNTSTLVFRIYIIWMKTSTATRLSPLGKNEQWMSGVIVWIIVIIVILT